MKFKQSNLAVFFLTVIAGFLGGIIGGVVVNNYFASPPFLSMMDNTSLLRSTTSLSNYYRTPSLFFSEEDRDLKDLPFYELYNNEIFLVRASEKKIGSFYDYSQVDILSYGFALSSDGWVVVASGEWSKVPLPQLRVLNGGKAYLVEKKVVDPSTGLFFLKLAIENNQLAVFSFADSEKISFLDKLVSFSRDGSVKKYSVEGIISPNLIKSSEEFSKRILLDSAVLPGQPLYTKEGEIAGIAEKENLVIPANYFKDIIKNILKEEKIKRVYLGVYYVDLDNSFLVNKERRDFGVLVYDKFKSKAIKKGSPAAKAGLQYGDIILSIEGEEIGVKKDLTEIIQEYHPGVEVEMDVLRNNKIKKIKVKLEELK